MSLAPNRPLTEITDTALRLLIQEMGIVNTVRFINQFSTGHGDSIADKEQRYGKMTVKDIAAAAKQRRRTTNE